MTQNDFDEDINYFGKCEFLYKLKQQHLGRKIYATIKQNWNQTTLLGTLWWITARMRSMIFCITKLGCGN